jgi:hypothetical protein
MDQALLFRNVPARLLVLEPTADLAVLDASDAWLRSRRVNRPSVVGRSLIEVLKPGPEAARVRVALGRVLASKSADEENSPVFAADGSLACIIHREAGTEAELLTSLAQRDRALRDLYTPLRALNDYCALLRNCEHGMLPLTAHDLLTRMDEGIRRMTGIIDGLIRLGGR